MLFLAALYCLIDTFLSFKFHIRLRPVHFTLRLRDFWSSYRKFLPLFLICVVALWIFPLLSVSAILFTRWPHPLFTAVKELWPRKRKAYFPLNGQKPEGSKLFEIATQDKPHILFIMLESFRAKNVGCLGAKVPLSPYFDALAEKGILFTRFHSTGVLSHRSMIASLFGIPAPHQPWYLGHYCGLTLHGLPQILADHGYESAFIQGGSTTFDHEVEFFGGQGFKTVLGKRDIAKPGTSWGVYDEHLMPYAASWLSSQKTPTFLTLLTTTNHHPWLHPDGTADFHKTYTYSDAALGLLIEDLRQRGLLEKSILFIFGDHGQRDSEINCRLYQDNVHVPLLIYAEGRQKPARVDTVSSQIDLLPTVLDLLNLSDPHPSLGKSLLRDSSAPIFFSHPFDTPIRGCRQGNWKYLIQEGREELYDLGTDPEEKMNRAGEKTFKEMTLSYFANLDHYYSGVPAEKKESGLYLDFSHSLKVTDAALEKMAKKHPHLSTASLSHCLLITDEGMKSLLTSCPKIEKLYINGLDEVSGKNWPLAPDLMHLKADQCPRMTVEWIGNLPSLKILQLGSANIGDEDLIYLAERQKNLSVLYLSDLPAVTERGVKALIEANPQLQFVSTKGLDLEG
jgi:hypothetical protein